MPEFKRAPSGAIFHRPARACVSDPGHTNIVGAPGREYYQLAKKKLITL